MQGTWALAAEGGRTFYCSLGGANMDDVQKGEIGLCVNEKYIFSLQRNLF